MVFSKEALFDIKNHMMYMHDCFGEFKETVK